MAAAAKEEAEAEAEAEASSCPLYRCFCCWRRVCSPRIPRVAPGRDYLCIPAGANDMPVWSVLVGCLSSSLCSISTESVLGLHRFVVARSGRILGRSDDALDILRTLRAIRGCTAIVSASAELAPDGRSICLFSEHVDPGKFFSAIPQANELEVTYKNPSVRRACAKEARQKPRCTITMSSLPRLPPDCPANCRPVSAAGHLWAPNIEVDRLATKCFVGMLRLNRDRGQWEKVGDTFSFPITREELANGRWPGPLLQGYAVLPQKTILVSLRADQGLLTFNCSNYTWTKVTTTEDTPYVPILGRGVHINCFGAVFFLRDNRIFAYTLSYHESGPRKLKLEPPAMIDSVCPFYDEGYGFLTHLGGLLMCSVWISTLLHCSCGYLHVLITTFRVRSGKGGKKFIEILHSTCRRLSVFPRRIPFHEFCFLQEYKDGGAVQHSMQDCPTSSHIIEKPSNSMQDCPTSSHVIQKPSKMLDCCSNFLSEPTCCYKFEEPPKDPALQINNNLYIICQASSQLIVYAAKIRNGRVKSHDKILKRKYKLDITVDDYLAFEERPPWHLVFSSSNSKIYAVSDTQHDIHDYMYSLKEKKDKMMSVKPTSDPMSIVLEVGDKIIAVSYTLRVFYHDKPKWVCCSHHTDESLVPNRKANLSGYAVIDGNSFIVSDADTGSFLLFDLRSGRWSVLRCSLPADKLLNGRSLFVDGFIYTCTSGGLLAYELVKQGNNHKDLWDPIFLQFSWQSFRGKSWVAERMCLDCADKDKHSDAIVFCVVQGEYSRSKSLGGVSISHDVHITTVQVKTQRASGGKRKPERIYHMDIATCFVAHDAALLWTKSCFAVGS